MHPVIIWTAIILLAMAALAVPATRTELANTRPRARGARRPHRAEPIPLANRIPRDMPIPGMRAGRAPKRRVAAGEGALAAVAAMRSGPLGWIWEGWHADYGWRGYPMAGPMAAQQLGRAA